jgi:nucleotide-binding universal stress UspA family protein
MHRFKNILYVVEHGVDNSAALTRAIALSDTNQAKLTVFGVLESIPDDRWLTLTALTPGEALESVVAEKREQLITMINAQAGERGISIQIESGRAFLQIIRAVLRDQYDLVIKPIANRPKTIRLLSSTDMHLLRKCPCPVWIVKASDARAYRHILAAVDVDPEDAASDAQNLQILEMSMSLALAESSELHIVHAWSLAYEAFLRSPRSGFTQSDVDKMANEERGVREGWLQRLIAEIGGRNNSEAVNFIRPQLHIERGNPKLVIPALAQELGAELVVMGTLGRSGIPGFLMGNTAEEVLEQIDCSVLAIKPQGFVSPVLAA